MNQNTLFVFGFQHSGTTILRTILGHINYSETFFPEVDPLDYPDFAKEAKYRVFKNTQTKDKYFAVPYHEIIKFFIIRNPLYVLSSCNRRYYKNKSLVSYIADRYLKMAKIFVRTKNENIPNLYHIKYEDMFLKGNRVIKEVLCKHNIEYNENIFQNELYKNFSHENQLKKTVPKNRPSDTDHTLLRLYQMNQPFQNNNDPLQIILQSEQINLLTGDKNIFKIYPEIIKQL